jgi:phosphoribosyl 1,2-cyclic phosphate phosphodiesterase
VYGNSRTTESLRRKYAYAFEQTQLGGGKPMLDLRTIEAGQTINVAGLPVTPIEVLHGSLPTLGYRFGRLAYVTDVSSVPEGAYRQLDGLELLVIDALRWRPHPTHFSIDEALAVVERVRPERTLFTHICHEIDHAATRVRLPAGVDLAYDGMVVEVADRDDAVADDSRKVATI